MSSKYIPGEVVTAEELEVADLIFLRERRTFGLPVPTHPARVTALTPLADGRVRVEVINPNAGAGVKTRLLGDLPASREFRRAVLDA